MAGGNYFAAYSDVTNLVQNSGTYTLANLEWSNGSPYCSQSSAYGAWSLVVVYSVTTAPKECEIQLCMNNFSMTFPAGKYWRTINCVNAPANCASNAQLTIIAFEGDNYKGEWFGIGSSNVAEVDYSWGGLIAPATAGNGNNFRGQTAPNLDILTYNVNNVVKSGTTSVSYAITSYNANTIWGTAAEGLFDFVKILKYDVAQTPGTACNDGNSNTFNDVVSADGCGCVGSPVNPCTLGPDTDGDGIKDVCDCDDDNDGILDTDECTTPSNVATGGIASQSSTYGNVSDYAATSAIDGNTTSGMAHTANATLTEWWQVDLRANKSINQIKIFNRKDCCVGRLNNVYVLVADTPFPANASDLAGSLANADYTYTLSSNVTGDITINIPSVIGRYVRLQKSGRDASSEAYINIAEVQVFACADTDNDGIADYLDNDSDNDGCPDAIEGSANYGLTDVDAQGRLKAAISSCGLAGGTPQGIGTSTNSAVKDPACTPPPTGSIGDMTYCDNNANGIMDNGDTPQSSVQVQLCNASNVIIATATTDAQGKYLFPNLAAGIYVVKFPATITGGKTITTNSPITVNLAAGQNYLDADGGYKPPVQTCADGSPKKTPGTACNDNNPNTINDVIQADGCGCSGVAVVDPCTVGVDTDGDGIKDACDCDDDNDGILDTDEFNGKQQIATGSQGSSTTSISFGYSAGNAAETVVNSSGLKNLTCGDGTYGAAKIYMEIAPTHSDPYNTSTASTLQVLINGTVYYQLNTTNNNSEGTPTQQTSLNGALAQAANDMNVHSAYTPKYYPVTISLPTNVVNTGQLSFKFLGDGSDDYNVRNISIITCGDTDNDGIPDSKDNDSDNDGCPDAIEGSANYGLTDVDAQGRLKAAISSCGLAGGTPQGIGTSTNSAVKDPACTPPPTGSIGDMTYCDNNANGIMDNGDTPQSGVQVQLCNASNVVIVNCSPKIGQKNGKR